MTAAMFLPCRDWQGRTCIKVEEAAGKVKFIPYDIDGLRVQSLKKETFSETYQPIPNYEPKRACEWYVKFVRHVGSTREALEWLKKAVTVPADLFAEVDALRAERAGRSAFGRPKDAPSMSKSMNEAIMAGGKPDSEIFAAIAKQWNLAHDKKHYVAWYRSKLKKAGKNPPEKMEEK